MSGERASERWPFSPAKPSYAIPWHTNRKECKSIWGYYLISLINKPLRWHNDIYNPNKMDGRVEEGTRVGAQNSSLLKIFLLLTLMKSNWRWNCNNKPEKKMDNLKFLELQLKDWKKVNNFSYPLVLFSQK